MKNFQHSLRFKLFFWYLLSLVLLGFFIILTIHIYQYKYSIQVLTIIFLFLALIGFLIIYRFTKSLAALSQKMKTISSKNLDEKINLEKRDDEIGELAKSFNDLLTRLDNAFKNERQFIADVAHEMKTPITILKSRFEVALHQERTNEEYKQVINESIKETDRLTATLEDILELAWSRISNENQKNNFNLSDLIKELTEIGKNLAQKKNIKVSSNVTSDIWIKGMRQRLGRGVLNIIDNAIKYTPQNGKIEITLEKDNNQAVIAVKDNGQGIEKSELENIFDRFYRGSKTDKIFGAGLGLAIAQSLIKMHKGNIKVVSKPKKGSTFFIFLPGSS